MSAIGQAGGSDPPVLTADRRMWMASLGSQAISPKSQVGIKGRLENFGTVIGIRPSWNRRKRI